MKIVKKDFDLEFVYEPYEGYVDWLEKKLEFYEEEPVEVAGTFYFRKSDLKEVKKHSLIFKIADYKDGYYKVDKKIINTSFDVYIFKDINIEFKHISCSKNKNLFIFIDEIRNSKEDIYIDGPKSTLTFDDLLKLIKQFPSSYEKELYNKARISQVFENYFDDVINYTEKLENYREKRKYSKIDNEKLYNEYDLKKYENIRDKIETMLHEETKYSEAEWAKKLTEIILILFPKYINFHEQVEVSMTARTSRKKKEKLDFMLVKGDGCIDVIEIKKASDIAIISNSCNHDNHYATSPLSKVTMQLEKYIYNITRDTINFEKYLNETYSKFYPSDFKFKVVNPKGLIIMGSSKNLSTKQLLDLEIIRRMYSNIIEIYTYDDILKMLDNIIFQLRKKIG